MTKQLWNLILGLLLLTGSALHAQQSQYSRLRIYTDGEHDIRQIAALGLDCQHGHHKKGAYLESDFSAEEIALLEAAGIRYEVLIADVVDFYLRRNQEGEVWSKRSASPFDNECGPPILNYPSPRHFRLGSMGGFLNHTELMAELDSMRARYPHLISQAYVIDSANLTHQGRYMYWWRISDNPDVDEQEPEALYTALHHSREPLSAMQLVYYMWYLLENYDISPEIQHLVNNTALYFIPCVNPDGYMHNEINSPNGGGMWRKNRRNNGGGSFGVDLNRNYGVAFAFDNAGSSGNPSSETYRGPSAFSEPETRNIRTFCNGRNLKLALNYHSFGNMLIYPWAYNSTQTADSTAFRELSVYLTRENRFITGTNEETVGYSSNGDADDWFYGEQTSKPKILSMTPEAGYQNDGFWPPVSQIEYLCRLNLWQNLRYAQVLLHHGELKDHSNPFVSQSTHRLRYELKRFGYEPGSFTVRVLPISPFVQAVGPAKVHQGLNQFDSVLDSIEVLINPTTPSGSIINLILELDNGFSTQQDTVYWIFGQYDMPLQDSANTMANWLNLGTNSAWGLSFQEYYSEPSSITDSPTGNYANSRTTELLLNTDIDLSQALEAHIQFWARWDIEKGYDYAQIMASDDGLSFTPLCGNYTILGSRFQDEEQPLYDGVQTQWVRERISLSDYLGQDNLRLKFRLVSDQAVRGDGFYFDDFSIQVLERQEITGLVMERSLAYSLGQSRPNPAKLTVFIPIEGEEPQGQLEILNALGQVCHTESLGAQHSGGLTLDISQWTAGLYYYRLRQNGGQSSAVRKMIIAP